MSELDDFRAAKDEFFGAHPHSPLTAEQKKAFAGLNYFPENLELRLEVKPEVFAAPETMRMQTTSGEAQTYTRYGRIHFTLAGQPAELTLYASLHGYFLPFVDSLAGVETYGAGRYLEPEELEGGLLRVDFNLAYNPYCAYNERWSCPITPAENRLKLPVRAGEKIFHA